MGEMVPEFYKHGVIANQKYFANTDEIEHQCALCDKEFKAGSHIYFWQGSDPYNADPYCRTCHKDNINTLQQHWVNLIEEATTFKPVKYSE